jgi:hypothetical protein
VTVLKRFCGITALLACSASLGICDVVPIVLRPLPTKYLNGENGAPRSNYAFTETGNPLLQTAIDGDSFTLGSSYVITSLSTYSVASVLGQPLGDEFEDIMLAVREVTSDPVGAPAPIYGNWDILDYGAPNTGNITDTNLTYSNGQDYEGDGTPGAYYPLWETTFSNLNFTAQAKVQYQFIVWGFGWNSPTCGTLGSQCMNMNPSTGYGYWYSEYSSGGSYLSFVNFENKDLCPTVSACDGLSPEPVQPQDASGNTVAVHEDVIIKGCRVDTKGCGVDVVATPEPGTRTLIGLGLMLVACLSRRLRK